LLRFWHWYKLGSGDQGTVEIKSQGGNWQTLSSTYSGSSGGVWTRARIDLSAYAGQVVQLAFHIKANADGNNGPGWFIDEVLVQAEVVSHIADTSIDEGQLLTLQLGLKSAHLAVNLDGAPQGAMYDPAFGLFVWQPTELQGPGVYPISLHITDPVSSLSYGLTNFAITVNEVNLPPVLEPIPAQVIAAGKLTTFTAAASDLDWPPNKLTFSLDVGAPLGATIDPNTGVFTWTPTAEQAATSRSISVRVTDNGSPPLSANSRFTAGPASPLVLSRSADGGLRLVLQYGSPGATYVIQATSELALPPSVTAWADIKPVQPAQFPFTIENLETVVLPARFYRFVEQPVR